MKKGDRVTITKNVSSHDFNIGEIVTVKSYVKEYNQYFAMNDYGNGACITEKDIEPITVTTVLKYHKLYQSYLLDQDLVETDDTLTVDKLIEFVEGHLLNQ